MVTIEATLGFHEAQKGWISDEQRERVFEQRKRAESSREQKEKKQKLCDLKGE